MIGKVTGGSNPIGLLNYCYYEKEKLKETILTHYQLYKQNNLKVYPVGLQYYSRKSLTEKLVKTCLTNH